MKFFSAHKQGIIIALVVASVIGGILLYTFFLKNNSTDVGGQSQDVVRHTIDSPSEEPITSTYSVVYGEPLSIAIDSINTKGYIQKVGVDQKQAVAAPNNIHLAGWFVDSVKPGEKGLSIIDGHEGGPTMDGIFKMLPSVAAGDTIVVTMGGGKTHTYEVFDTKNVPNTEAAAVLFEQNPTVASQLNLITCTGRFDTQAQTYSNRFIIYAKLQSEQ